MESLCWNKKNKAAVNREEDGVDVAWLLNVTDAKNPLLLLTADRREGGVTKKKTPAHSVEDWQLRGREGFLFFLGKKKVVFLY